MLASWLSSLASNSIICLLNGCLLYEILLSQPKNNHGFHTIRSNLGLVLLSQTDKKIAKALRVLHLAAF
jgi:hypothetical protein